MSIYLQEELWVTVEEATHPNAPCPRPLSSGFSLDTAYKVLGLHCPSETSEAFFILCNDRKEIWFISNRHFRVQGGLQYVRALGSSVPQSERGDLDLSKKALNGQAAVSVK